MTTQMPVVLEQSCVKLKTAFSMENTKCIEVRKDYYLLIIEDKSLGEFEKSQLRHILEVIDNAI